MPLMLPSVPCTGLGTGDTYVSGVGLYSLFGGTALAHNTNEQPLWFPVISMDFMIRGGHRLRREIKSEPKRRRRECQRPGRGCGVRAWTSREDGPRGSFARSTGCCRRGSEVLQAGLSLLHQSPCSVQAQDPALSPRGLPHASHSGGRPVGSLGSRLCDKVIAKDPC